MSVRLILMYSGALLIVIGVRVASRASAMPEYMTELGLDSGALIAAVGVVLIGCGVALGALRRWAAGH